MTWKITTKDKIKIPLLIITAPIWLPIGGLVIGAAKVVEKVKQVVKK